MANFNIYFRILKKRKVQRKRRPELWKVTVKRKGEGHLKKGVGITVRDPIKAVIWKMIDILSDQDWWLFMFHIFVNRTIDHASLIKTILIDKCFFIIEYCRARALRLQKLIIISFKMLNVFDLWWFLQVSKIIAEC